MHLYPRCSHDWQTVKKNVLYFLTENDELGEKMYDIFPLDCHCHSLSAEKLFQYLAFMRIVCR